MHATDNHSDMPDVSIARAEGASRVVLVCEHASALIPASFDLGLAPEARHSHAAWDPGALAVAEALSDRLDAALVAGVVSRLIHDCNRPPGSPEAMPERSEVIDIPGNAGLDASARAHRAEAVYHPFHDTVAEALAARPDPVLVTIHSFTPVYHGRPRAVEIGILHDADARLAEAMLARAPSGPVVRRNDPYGPEHGVTHTLVEHALPRGLPNVMIEIRNDLIADGPAQGAIADLLAPWLTRALDALERDAA